MGEIDEHPGSKTGANDPVYSEDRLVDAVGLRTRIVVANGLRFHVVDDGAGPVVMLLHGFPDTSRMWAPQVSFLLENGYRVVAPDLRGCGLSERPIGVEHYAFESLIADVLGIADALDITTFTVVAHDWGGILAWILAALVPDRVVAAAILSAPHPNELFPIRSVEQARQSFYMLQFQHPGVAEQWLRANDWRIRELFEGSEVEALIADLTPPGKLETRLDWYRAGASAESFFLETSDEDVPPVIVPVLLLSGARDQFLTEPPFQLSRQRCTGYFHHERLDAGHWIAYDQPERVHALLLEFLHMHGGLVATAAP